MAIPYQGIPNTPYNSVTPSDASASSSASASSRPSSSEESVVRSAIASASELPPPRPRAFMRGPLSALSSIEQRIRTATEVFIRSSFSTAQPPPLPSFCIAILRKHFDKSPDDTSFRELYDTLPQEVREKIEGAMYWKAVSEAGRAKLREEDVTVPSQEDITRVGQELVHDVALDGASIPFGKYEAEHNTHKIGEDPVTLYYTPLAQLLNTAIEQGNEACVTSLMKDIQAFTPLNDRVFLASCEEDLVHASHRLLLASPSDAVVGKAFVRALQNKQYSLFVDLATKSTLGEAIQEDIFAYLFEEVFSPKCTCDRDAVLRTLQESGLTVNTRSLFHSLRVVEEKGECIRVLTDHALLPDDVYHEAVICCADDDSEVEIDAETRTQFLSTLLRSRQLPLHVIAKILPDLSEPDVFSVRNRAYNPENEALLLAQVLRHEDHAEADASSSSSSSRAPFEVQILSTWHEYQTWIDETDSLPLKDRLERAPFPDRDGSIENYHFMRALSEAACDAFCESDPTTLPPHAAFARLSRANVAIEPRGFEFDEEERAALDTAYAALPEKTRNAIEGHLYWGAVQNAGVRTFLKDAGPLPTKAEMIAAGQQLVHDVDGTPYGRHQVEKNVEEVASCAQDTFFLPLLSTLERALQHGDTEYTEQLARDLAAHPYFADACFIQAVSKPRGNVFEKAFPLSATPHAVDFILEHSTPSPFALFHLLDKASMYMGEREDILRTIVEKDLINAVFDNNPSIPQDLIEGMLISVSERPRKPFEGEIVHQLHLRGCRISRERLKSLVLSGEKNGRLISQLIQNGFIAEESTT